MIPLGFFFSKKKQEAKRRPQGLRTAPVTKQNKEILNRLGCKACPLDKAKVCTPNMPPVLAKETLIYFLGDIPSQYDDEQTGKPLTGVYGNVLRECIPKGELPYCSFDNVVRDRPPEGRQPTWNEIEACRGNIIASIERAKPKLIVGLGVPTLSWALGSTDMDGMRGRVFSIKVGKHTCWFMPTWHPELVYRFAYNKKKPLTSRLGHCLRMDILRAFKSADQLPEATVDTEEMARAGVQTFDGHGGANSLQTLLDLMAEALKAPEKAVDIETSCLRPFAHNSRILTVAISFGDTHFSFAVDHPKAGWQKPDKINILNLLEEILKDDTKKIAHNLPFELEWFIEYYGKEVVNHAAGECTMMQAHLIDERRGKQVKGGDIDSRRSAYQSLDFLIKQYFGIAYKGLFKLNKKDMASADLGETLVYNAVDTKYTLRLHKHQKAILKREGLLQAYVDALPRQSSVAIMQHIGIHVSQDEVKKAQEKLGTEIEGILKQIKALPVIKQYIKDKKEFNPQSGDDVIAVFRDYLKRPEIEITDKKGVTKTSVDKNVLDKIDHPLSQLLIQLRNRAKVKSVNVDPFELGKGEYIWPDGKIHTNFNTTFTETARTSSDSPNLQNFPKRNDSWVRKEIKPEKGHVLLAFDYGQLQACTAAMCSKDKAWVKALWEDYDTHMEWAQRLNKIDPDLTFQHVNGDMKDPKTAKKYRSIIKNKLTFPAIFGATNESIAGYLNANPESIEKVMKDFWRTFSGLKNWQDALMRGYYENGYVIDPVGRKHNYPITRNQAINYPVQAAEAIIVCDAMNKLSIEASKSGDWFRHPILNIHDDLTFVVPDDDKIIEDVIEKTYKIMLTPKYDWINVPLAVECSIGPDWFNMQDVGKFYSNKDL